LAYPKEDGELLEQAKLLEQALWLMDRFGTLGGRSRNGWGSFSLQSESDAPLTGMLPLREWTACLDRDWPHAIGKDARPLIWQTTPQTDWKRVMMELAKLKIALRTSFAFNKGLTQQPVPRDWLSYPVTHHDVMDWKKKNLRLPNSLRFKVRSTENRQLVGVIFHVPCLPPSNFHPDVSEIKAVWKKVHTFLDEHNGLSRIQE
jgi:CRISPR-associated protein Cmr1